MIKIMITCRNRLSITCKCLTAIQKFSKLPHQIFIYDNLTNYKIQEHFLYFSLLYEKGIISQYTVNTKESTFNSFSKAVASNMFLTQHSQDPKKDECDFLVCMDNDIIIVKEGWDEILKNAWTDIKKLGFNNIKIIGSYPGGIKNKILLKQKIAERDAVIGKLGGSGFWSFQPNFYEDVGLLDLKKLVGLNKKHDQLYWNLLDKSSKGKEYIMGLKDKLVVHCGGKIASSVCNILTRNNNNKNKLDLIKFEEIENKIDAMTFNEFYNTIINDNELLNNW